jgi:hypothetical protein
MVSLRGLICSDFHFFKIIIQKNFLYNFKRDLIYGKKYIFKKSFHKRRNYILKALIESLNFKYQFNFKFKKNTSKIYDNSGIYLISTNSFAFFKILNRKIDVSFFIKKLNFFFFENLKNLHKQKFIIVIDRFDLLPVSCKKIVKNFISKNKNENSWILSFKNCKNFRSFVKRCSNKAFFNCENKLKFEYLKPIHQHCPFLSEKTKDYGVNYSIWSIFYKTLLSKFKIFNAMSEFLIFTKFLVFSWFYSLKTIKLELLSSFVPNSILISYNKIFFNKLIELKPTKNENHSTKMYKKKNYIQTLIDIFDTITN